MPLRLLEITLPEEALSGVPDLIQEMTYIHLRTVESTDGTGVVTVLLEAHDVEVLSDFFVSRFGAADSFRLIMLTVEATLPLAVEAKGPPLDTVSEDQAQTLNMQRISREELYDDISQASKLSSTYLIMVVLSTVVAIIGLTRGDVAIIIGAMVIAPLLGPNMALALSMTLGDADLGKQSMKTICAGVLTAVVLSVLFGVIFLVDPDAPEIVARTQPSISDAVLALAAGVAGSLAFTSGVPAVVVGVMVAVALLPPLVVFGMLIGAGHSGLASGAMVLLLTNVICVNLAAIATFVSQKISPRLWWEAKRARRHARRALVIWASLLAGLLMLIYFGFVGTA